MAEVPASPVGGGVRRILIPIGVGLAWYAGFGLTPGLLDHGIGSLLSSEFDVAIAIESAVATVLAVTLLAVLPRVTRVVLAPSRTAWLYLIPVVGALLLPLHYRQDVPIGLYVVWMTVSVFWQDYLTFGILQDTVRAHLPRWATIMTVGLMFWSAHALFLPDRFLHPIPAAAIVVLGLVLATLRDRLGTLHVILACHLGFYLIVG